MYILVLISEKACENAKANGIILQKSTMWIRAMQIQAIGQLPWRKILQNLAAALMFCLIRLLVSAIGLIGHHIRMHPYKSRLYSGALLATIKTKF